MQKPQITLGRILSIIFHSTLLMVNLGVVLLLVGASYVDRISPEKIPYIAYLGMLFPIFAIANVIFLIYWSALRRWRFALLPLLAIALSWSAASTYFPLNVMPESPKEGSIKLLSYNVRQFDLGKRDANKKSPTLEYIVAQKADIICLQEFGYSQDSKMLRLAEIRKRLKDYPYYHVYKITDNHWHTYGLACFSKYPLTDVKSIDFGSEYNGAVAYTVKVNGTPVRIVNCHLESNKFTSEDRILFKGVVEGFSTERLAQVKSSLVEKMNKSFGQRAAQARRIRDHVDQCGMESIICGDFNDTPLSYTYRTLRGNRKDAFVESASGLGITYHENHFYFRIDHILYSKAFTGYGCQIDRVKHSDHYPVHTYLYLNNNE